MKCVICKGMLKQEEVDVPFEYKGRFVLLRKVKARVCDQCGEVYLSAESDQRVKAVLNKIDKGEAKAEIREMVVET